MTKIRLTNRKAANSPNSEYPSNSGSASFNNNNNGSLLYRSLSGQNSSTTNDDYIDSQFQRPPSRIPTRSICLASFLCFAGSSLLVFGLLVLSGHLDAKFADRAWPMIIMGFLMFIPGAYHVRIAYYAHRGIPGYSFDDIPEFE
ncbi:Transmembrane protein [Orchesella cincta]|uniref:Transmembrane protein 230 n=1 Tax=Orchesella cincta TaxID=48709 RepID=A0A1D2NJ41_ORCCI|nr:Transmembrane protein [Orchesella cincta]